MPTQPTSPSTHQHRGRTDPGSSGVGAATAAWIPGPAEIAAYRDQGYLLPPADILPEADFHRLAERFAVLAEDARERYGLAAEDLDKPHFLYPELYDVLLHPRVLDLVEPLIGPDIALFTSHFICKPPRTGRRVPWHEDSAYWARLFDPIDDICTVWLAIDPSTPGNGCLRVIPGSHRGGDSTYRAVERPQDAVFGSEIVPHEVDDAQAVDLTLTPNRCSIHHARIIHGSEPNRSDARRCGFTMRYASTRCRFLRGDLPASFRIHLARGRDHAGNAYAEPGFNAAWADELLSRRRAAAPDRAAS